MKVYLEVYGCQMNEDDANRLASMIHQRGAEFVKTLDSADVILIHTCSVREKPEKKLFGLLGRIERVKRNNPKLVVGVGGCVAKQEEKTLLGRFWGVDFLFSSYHLHKVPSLLASIMDISPESRPRYSLLDQPTAFEESLFPDHDHLRKGAPTAFVTIMQGCDHKCSFCIVPYVRGPEVSRSSQSILNEVQRLVDEGVREITLLGQNVNRYGKSNHDIPFHELLRRLDRIEGLRRVRFTTSNPTDVGDALIECFRNLRTLCPQLHLPVQSGSDRILDLMARGYTRNEYLRIVDKLRKACPDIALSTDLIVGFPSETEEDFKDTLTLVEEIGYESAFSFKYSKRPFTEAARIQPQVNEEIKEERLSVLQDRLGKIHEKKIQCYVGSVQEILVEKPSKKRHEELMGRTPKNYPTVFPGDPSWIGTIVPVKITEVAHHTLLGRYNG